MGRFSPSIKKEKLKNAMFINEIMPGFCRHVSLPYKESTQMNQLLALVEPSKENYIYPRNTYFRVKENYEKIMDYVFIEISATHLGKTLTYANTTDALTTEQKNILNSADFGTDIYIKIRFKYKSWTNVSDHTTKEAEYRVTVIPEIEAVYPGGNNELTIYLTKNIFDKISEKSTAKKIQNAIVTFNINEDGEPVDAKLIQTSKDQKIDQLILDAIHKMPKWTTAKNSDGTIVQEKITIPFGGGGC